MKPRPRYINNNYSEVLFDRYSLGLFASVSLIRLVLVLRRSSGNRLSLLNNGPLRERLSESLKGSSSAKVLVSSKYLYP